MDIEYPNPDVKHVLMASGLLLRMAIDPATVWRDEMSAAIVDVTKQVHARGNATPKLIEVARECALRAGFHRDEMRNSQELMARAYTSGMFASVFQMTFGTVLLKGYETEIDSTVTWCSEGISKTLKPELRVGLGTFRAKRLPRGGAAAVASPPTEFAPMNQAHRFALTALADEQDLIDDNISAIAQIFDSTGRALRRIRPDWVYATLLSNPVMPDGVPLFDAAHANRDTNALTAANLATGMSAVGTQRIDGVPLHLRADHLIVPPSLEDTARSLARSLVVGDDIPLRVVVEPRLQHGVTHPLEEDLHVGGSPTCWFLAASSSNKTLEASYLHGRKQPDTTEYPLQGTNIVLEPNARSRKPPLGRWGMAIDGKIDLGVAPLDFRALYQGNT